MKKLFASKCVYVSDSKIKMAGHGVFASRNIKKGELVENCPLIEIPKKELPILNKSFLVTYLFYFGKGKNCAALALGFGSIYNHSRNANAKFEIKEKQMQISFIATTDIKKDSEITFNYYNGSPHNQPLWFEVE